MPNASVLPATYRHVTFIDDSIRRVLVQTMQDWKMIVVDHGSEDGTLDTTKSSPDPGIVALRRLHGVKGAIGSAITSAVARPHGPFLAVLEGDDTWWLTKFEDDLSFFSDLTVVLAYCAMEALDEEDHLYVRHWQSPRRSFGHITPVEVIPLHLDAANFIFAVTVMVRRSALGRIDGFVHLSCTPYVDYLIWLRPATTGTFARSWLVLGHRRRHAGQVTARSWLESTPDRATYRLVTTADTHDVGTLNALTTSTVAILRDSSRQYEEALIAHGRLECLEGNWWEAAAIFMPLEERRAKNRSSGCGGASVRWKQNRHARVDRRDWTPFSPVASSPSFVWHLGTAGVMNDTSVHR